MECNIINISTHALTEGDNIIRKYIDVSGISTHALTEGDKRWAYQVIRENISTHALTEGDGNSSRVGEKADHFNSRPHGGRPPARRLPATL